MTFDLRSRAVAEFLGTAFLLAAVVGSGIMGERLAGGNVAIALLANTLSTGAILMVLVLTLAPISGAHFNPAVTLAMSVTGDLPWREAPVYLASQILGAFAGVASAHLMFGLPLFFASNRPRHGAAQLWSEAVATFGLIFVIWGCSRFPSIRYGIRGRSLHNLGILVHGVHIVRESRGNTGPFGQRYVRWHPSRRRAWIRHGASHWRIGGDVPFPLAGACPSQPRRIADP